MIPPLASTAVVTGLIVWLAFHQGGFFEDARLTAAVAAWAALAVVCGIELPNLRLSAAALVALAALALLAGWTALSTSWSLDPLRADRAVDLALLYVALFALALFAVGTGRYARVVLLAAAAAATAVCGVALWARLHPGAFGSPLPDLRVDGYRMDWPLGYWNALGGVGSLGLALGLGIGADPRSPVVVRALAAGAATVCGVAAYLTFSRSAVIAVAVAVVVLIALGAHRASLVATLLVVGVAVGIAIARLEATPALTTDPARAPGQADAGATMTPILALLVVAAAGVQATLAIGNRSAAVADLARRTARPLAIGVSALVAAAAIGGYVLRADAVEGRVSNALRDSGDWIDRQWDEFNRPGAQREAERGSARLDTAGGTRADLWGAALDGFAAAPLRGEGAGSYQVRFFRERETDDTVQNAHSLPLETLSELGLVGGILILTFLGAVTRALVLSRRRRLALPSSQTAAAGAAVAAWLVHASVDWDWQMPALTGLALLIAATLFPAGRRRRRRGARPGGRPGAIPAPLPPAAGVSGPRPSG